MHTGWRCKIEDRLNNFAAGNLASVGVEKVNELRVKIVLRILTATPAVEDNDPRRHSTPSRVVRHRPPAGVLGRYVWASKAERPNSAFCVDGQQIAYAQIRIRSRGSSTNLESFEGSAW